MIKCSLPGTLPTRVSPSFSSIDMLFPSSYMNVAEITLSARYPESGYAINRQSEMVVRILQGAVRFSCEGETVEFPTGSTVFVATNKKYYWDPLGSVVLYVVSSPPWTAEQAERVSE
jgi:mannose-6-phosphate isomerase-like protein (cupin superfamily)